MKPLLHLLGLGVLLSLPCRAQDGPLHKRVSVDFRGVPVATALKDLGAQAGVQFDCPEKLLAGQDLVTCEAKNQAAGRVAARILRPRGMKVEKLEGSRAMVTKLDPLDEFRVKREEVYEFTEKPRVTRDGDKVTIDFTTKSFCDVTVAIEDANGRIIRHLASGVLGEYAPEPFLWNSKKQTLVWDGKTDQDVYFDDKESVTVRVSLGLKPKFEKNLYWSPYKRMSEMSPVLAATEEGIVVAEGYGRDSVRLYDHEGRYRRTLYPFPAAKVAGGEVKGMEWMDLPHGGRIPLKNRWYGQTLLTSGDSSRATGASAGMGRGMSGIAARGDRVALVFEKLNRLSTAGATWGEGLAGGACCVTNGRSVIGPASAALSPDGKWLYLAGYSYRNSRDYDTLHGVARMPADGSGGLEPFLGSLKIREGFGTEPGKFRNAASVDCDSKGRIYVADWLNDRVQIFSPEGAFLKSVTVEKPAIVRVHRKNDEIYVFSWTIPSRLFAEQNQSNTANIEPAVTRFGAFDDPKQIQRHVLAMLPKVSFTWNQRGVPDALLMTGEIDSWTEPATIWIGRECRNDRELAGVHSGDGGQVTSWETAGVKVLRAKNGQLEVIKDFGKDTLKEAFRAKPPANAIQRIVVNPVNGKLYVGEPDSAPTGKAFCNLLEIDPETGKTKVVELPFNPMEYAFDLDGNIYLRNTDMIARYAFPSLREIPWDYGTERDALGCDGGIGGRTTAVKAGLQMPAKWPVCYHQGGIGVSPKGYVVAACAYVAQGIGSGPRVWEFAMSDIRKNPYAQGITPYKPTVFPGRASNSLTPCIHIWDKHGKTVVEDAVPGVAQVDGVEIDKDLNLYYMHSPRRVFDGKPYYTVSSSTLMKTRPGAVKILSTDTAELVLSDESRPKRPPDLNRAPEGNMWVEGGAEWMYGGVGFAAFNCGNYCGCEFSRFSIDYFGRSIAPEPYQYAVAILDSNGNLIQRIGRCGNVDDGIPTRSAERGMRSEDRDPGAAGSSPDSALRSPNSALK